MFRHIRKRNPQSWQIMTKSENFDHVSVNHCTPCGNQRNYSLIMSLTSLGNRDSNEMPTTVQLIGFKAVVASVRTFALDPIAFSCANARGLVDGDSFGLISVLITVLE